MFSLYISEVDFGINRYLHIMKYAYKKAPEECIRYHFSHTLYSHMICDTHHTITSIGLHHDWTIVACTIILCVLTAQLVDVWGLEYGSGHATPPHGFH